VLIAEYFETYTYMYQTARSHLITARTSDVAALGFLVMDGPERRCKETVLT